MLKAPTWAGEGKEEVKAPGVGLGSPQVLAGLPRALWQLPRDAAAPSCPTRAVLGVPQDPPSTPRKTPVPIAAGGCGAWGGCWGLWGGLGGWLCWEKVRVPLFSCTRTPGRDNPHIGLWVPQCSIPWGLSPLQSQTGMKHGALLYHRAQRQGWDRYHPKKGPVSTCGVPALPAPSLPAPGTPAASSQPGPSPPRDCGDKERGGAKGVKAAGSPRPSSSESDRDVGAEEAGSRPFPGPAVLRAPLPCQLISRWSTTKGTSARGEQTNSRAWAFFLPSFLRINPPPPKK